MSIYVVNAEGSQTPGYAPKSSRFLKALPLVLGALAAAQLLLVSSAYGQTKSAPDKGSYEEVIFEATAVGESLAATTSALAPAPATTQSAHKADPAPNNGQQRPEMAMTVAALLPSVEEMPALGRTVTLKLQDATLARALDRVAAEAGLRVAYLRETVDTDRRVTLKAEGRTAHAAFRSVLEGTDLTLTRASGTQLVLVPRRALQEAAAHRPEAASLQKIQAALPATVRAPERMQGTITGTVTDADTGEPLPGVSVAVEDTQLGAATGADGTYQIPGVEPGTYTVRASFVGYGDETEQAVEVSEGATTTVDFTMTRAVENLDEVVVVGYGTEEAADVTGSVSSVDAEELSQLSASNPLESLRGKAAGVQVTRYDGKPGSGGFDLKIRGIGSINGADPLVIVDGVRRGAGDVNPEDIASVDVLKDAASASIYGAKAANGVILITTKSGQRDQGVQVNFKTRLGARNPIDLPNKLGTQDYLRLGAEARLNSGVAREDLPSDFQKCVDGGGGSCGEGLANTDWMDEVFNMGVEQSYDLSISGGSGDLNYYISGGYVRENGFKYDETFDQYTLRINSDFDVTDDLRIGETLNLSRNVNDPSHSRDLPMRVIPVFPVRDESNPYGGWGQGPTYWQGGNPVGFEHVNDQVNKNNTVEGNVYAELDLIESLTARVNLGLSYNSSSNSYYRGKFDWGTTANLTDFYNVSFGTGTRYNGIGRLNFDRTFGSHSIEAVAGVEAVSAGNGLSLSARAQEFNVGTPRSLGLAQGTPTVRNTSTQNTPYRLLSQFGRVNYDYDGRYLLQMNVRRDGSSKFGDEYQWGVFPGFSAGWRISEEPFMENVDFISNLKLRGGYGVLGTDDPIGNFAFVQTYVPSDDKVAFGNTPVTNGYGFGGYPNRDVKWEEIRQTDIGLDVAFLEGRFGATVNYYSKNTTDMLFPITLPGSSGAEGEKLETNVGEVQNQGVELELSWQDSFGDLQYSLSANGSYNQNEVQKLSGEQGAFIASGGTRTLSNTSRTVSGRPIGSFYGYKVEGIFRNQDQVDEYNARTEDGTFYTDQNTAPGDLIFTDLNGDGQITSDDRTFIGNPWPRWNYGFNADLQYMGFDLTVFLQGAANFDILNNNKAFFEQFYQDYNTTTQAFDRWTPQNRDADQPRLSINDPNGNYTRVNEYLIEDGTYLKLRHVQLGYNLPSALQSALGTRNLRLFVSAENLFTLTGYSGTDPEVAGGNTNWGIDSRRYPQTRLYTVGVNLGF